MPRYVLFCLIFCLVLVYDSEKIPNRNLTNFLSIIQNDHTIPMKLLAIENNTDTVNLITASMYTKLLC